MFQLSKQISLHPKLVIRNSDIKRTCYSAAFKLSFNLELSYFN